MRSKAQTKGDSVAETKKNTPEKLAPGLYIVATPIGNLRDMTRRATDVLSAADVIACEDTRTSQTLLTHYGVKRPLISYHDHNAGAMRPKILDRLADGQAVALISDAGTPLISDPGYKLVAAAQDAGHKVFPIPGPSALIAALSACGLPTDRVLFLGFLPNKEKARTDYIARYSKVDASLVFYESPKRLAASLHSLTVQLGAERKAAVCRELTKRFEEIYRAPLGELTDEFTHKDHPVKGEIVIVVSPPEQKETGAGEDELEDALRDAMQHLSLKEAVQAVTWMTNTKRRTVYQKALAIKQDMEKTDEKETRP